MHGSSSLTTKIIAHRGASHDRRENTLAAFELAIELQADGIEFDVQQTADGVFIVYHDDTVPIANAPRLDTTPWDDFEHVLRRQRVEALKLVDALAALKGRIFLNLELKSTVNGAEAVARVAELAQTQLEVGQYQFSAFQVNTLRHLKAVAPTVPRALLVPPLKGWAGWWRRRRLAHELAAVGATQLHVPVSMVPTSSAPLLCMGVPIWTYTVDSAPQLARLMAMPTLSGIFTNELARAIDIRHHLCHARQAAKLH